MSFQIGAGAGSGVPSFDSSYQNLSLSELMAKVGRVPKKDEKKLFNLIIEECQKSKVSKQVVLDGIATYKLDLLLGPAHERLLDKIKEAEADAEVGGVIVGLGVPEETGVGQPQETGVRHPLPHPGSVVTQRQVPTEEELFPTLTKTLQQKSLFEAFAILDVIGEPSKPVARECLETVSELTTFLLKGGGDTLKKLYAELASIEFVGDEQNRERIKALKEYDERVPRTIARDIARNFMPTEQLEIASEVLLKLYEYHKDLKTLEASAIKRLKAKGPPSRPPPPRPDAAKAQEPETIKGAISSDLGAKEAGGAGLAEGLSSLPRGRPRSPSHRPPRPRPALAKPDAAKAQPKRVAFQLTAEQQKVKTAISSTITSALRQVDRAVADRKEADVRENPVVQGDLRRRADNCVEDALSLTNSLWKDENALNKLAMATGLSIEELKKMKAEFQKIEKPTETDTLAVLNQLQGFIQKR